MESSRKSQRTALKPVDIVYRQSTDENIYSEKSAYQSAWSKGELQSLMNQKLVDEEQIKTLKKALQEVIYENEQLREKEQEMNKILEEALIEIEQKEQYAQKVYSLYQDQLQLNKAKEQTLNKQLPKDEQFFKANNQNDYRPNCCFEIQSQTFQTFGQVQMQNKEVQTSQISNQSQAIQFPSQEQAIFSQNQCIQISSDWSREVLKNQDNYKQSKAVDSILKNKTE